MANIQFPRRHFPPEILLSEFTASAPNSTPLLAGSGIALVPGPGPTLTVVNTGDGTGGAPINAEYLVKSLNASLSDERAVDFGPGLDYVDAGPGDTFTVILTSALLGASYLTWDPNDTILTDKRQLIFDTGLTATDNGSAITVQVSASLLVEFPDNLVISSNATIGDNDSHYIEVDTTGGNRLVTLPDPTSHVGSTYKLVRISSGSNLATIQPPSGSISGRFSNWRLYYKGECLELEARSSGWWIT